MDATRVCKTLSCEVTGGTLVCPTAQAMLQGLLPWLRYACMQGSLRRVRATFSLFSSTAFWGHRGGTLSQAALRAVHPLGSRILCCKLPVLDDG